MASPDFSSCDTGQISRASDTGACLPPRKRLLAGLKQSGWLSSIGSCGSVREDSKISQESELLDQDDQHAVESRLLQGKSSAVEHSDSDCGSGRKDSGSTAALNTQKLKLRRFSLRRHGAMSSCSATEASLDGTKLSESPDIGIKGKSKKTVLATKKPKRNGSRESWKNRKAKSQLSSPSTSLIRFPMNDEELALQLHRAMNSSPRISGRHVSMQLEKENTTLQSQSCGSANPRRPKQRASLEKKIEEPVGTIKEADAKLSSTHDLEEEAISSPQGAICVSQYADAIGTDWIGQDDSNMASLVIPRFGDGKSGACQGLCSPLSGDNITKCLTDVHDGSAYSNNENNFSPTQEAGVGNVSSLPVEQSIDQEDQINKEGKVHINSSCAERKLGEMFFADLEQNGDHIYNADKGKDTFSQEQLVLTAEKNVKESAKLVESNFSAPKSVLSNSVNVEIEINIDKEIKKVSAVKDDIGHSNYLYLGIEAPNDELEERHMQCNAAVKEDSDSFENNAGPFSRMPLPKSRSRFSRRRRP